jgi:hypothetical protein
MEISESLCEQLMAMTGGSGVALVIQKFVPISKENRPGVVVVVPSPTIRTGGSPMTLLMTLVELHKPNSVML